MLRFVRSILNPSSMAAVPPSKPLITIVGSTGTGKSQLAVDLALQFKGEVINADVMQMYNGLPIITNKLPEYERKDVPHHLIGGVSVTDPPWRVGKFVKSASELIDNIHDRGKLPILVGGTHYYAQSLLFHNTLAEVDGGEDLEPDFTEPETWPILQGTTDEILAKLREVDPIMADRWHPNERRKIRRSLEIYLKSGQRASDLYASQRPSKKQTSIDESGTNGSENLANIDVVDPAETLRYPTLVFSTWVEGKILRDRLESRVQKMMGEGLLKEAIDLDALHKKQEKLGKPIDRTRGIHVAVGYKEFEKLCQALQDGVKDSEKLQLLEDEAVEQTKNATHQYAKTQLRWIRNKLVTALREAGNDPPVLVVDTSELEMWKEVVVEPAAEQLSRFLSGRSVKEIAMNDAISRDIFGGTNLSSDTHANDDD